MYAQTEKDSRPLWVSIALTIAILAVTAPFYGRAGIAFDWWSLLPGAALLAVLLALRIYFDLTPGSAADRVLADLVLVTFLILLVVYVASPSQYLALALKRPLVDSRLAHTDERLGIRVDRLAAWTGQHPLAVYASWLAYSMFIPELVAALVVLGIVYRNRDRLWELCFHFHVCLAVTLLAFALFPAASAFQYYAFAPPIDETEYIAQFKALEAGVYHVLHFGQLQGFVSMPSFHVAGALISAWTLRGYRSVGWAFAAVTCALAVSTFMTGVHYLVDSLGSVVLVAGSVAAYRALSARPR